MKTSKGPWGYEQRENEDDHWIVYHKDSDNHDVLAIVDPDWTRAELDESGVGVCEIGEKGRCEQMSNQSNAILPGPYNCMGSEMVSAGHVARRPASEVVREQVTIALLLYGHPIVARDWIAGDLRRKVMDEWAPSYAREAKDLKAIMSTLSVMPERLSGSPLVEAAKGHWANLTSIELSVPKVPRVRDPMPNTPVEQAWSDWNNLVCQVKAGRWREHRRTHRKGWSTNLCDYDKDAELRARYPLEKGTNYPPEQFQKDAAKWRDDFYATQVETIERAKVERARVLEEWFGESDMALAEFMAYCHRKGVKVW